MSRSIPGRIHRSICLLTIVIASGCGGGTADRSAATSGPGDRVSTVSSATNTSGPDASQPSTSNSGTSESSATSESEADTVDLPIVEPKGVETLRGADGLFPTEVLLSWWAASVEPIDGVKPLEAEMLAGAENSTLIRSLLQTEAKLPDPVREYLDEIVAPTTSQPAGFAGVRRSPTQADLTQAEGVALVEAMKPILERWLGEPIGLELSTRVSNRVDVFDGPLVGAMAVVNYFRDSIVGPCVVHVRQSGGPIEGSEQWRRSAILHELYHCYQYRLVGSGAQTAAQPPWVAEGTAAYVGEKLSGGSVYSDLWMKVWLESANGELSRRAYDAIGLFWLLDDARVNVKRRLDELVTSTADTAGRLSIALGSDRAVAAAIRHRWGSHIANRTWSNRWAPPRSARFPAEVRSASVPFSYVAGGRPVILRSRGMKAGIFGGRTSGDLLTITVSGSSYGAVRMPDGTDLELSTGEHRFCLTAQACAPCPATGQQPLGGPAVASAEGELTIGAMTDSEGFVTLAGKRWAEVCGEEPTDTEPPVEDANKCTDRVSKADFRRLTGETYANAYESSRDECLFEDANFNLMMDLDATPLDTTAAKAAENLRAIFVDGPDGGYSVVSTGWYFAALSPDGRQFIGVHSGKQFFSTASHPRITTNEMKNLTKFYLASF